MTKRALTAECRRRLSGYSCGDELSADDTAFFVGLIRQGHPRASEKLEGFGGRVFADGQGGIALDCGDVSWRKCISPETHRTRAAKAFRVAVRDETREARSGDSGLHSHHEGESFAAILAGFMDARGLSWGDVAIEPWFASVRLVDHDLAADWRAFHAERCRLRAVEPGEHRRMHKKTLDRLTVQVH